MNSAKGIFVTGTDTGVGKTWVTVALMEALKRQGREVSGMKPIASGAKNRNGRLMNDDAYLIMQHCSEPTDYDLINPVIFEPSVAPAIAAKLTNMTINLEPIKAAYNQLSRGCQNVVVEGVGGWRVPISDSVGSADLVRELALPVIIVVGLRLGCINHAVLTAEAIRTDGVDLCGWVSSQLEKDYVYKEETINLLNEVLGCPHVADQGYAAEFCLDRMSENFDSSFILGQLN
jgi:dethiobiotin synthetase